MLKYVAGRVGRACITIFLVLCIVFLLMRLMPVETYFQGRSDTMSDTLKQNILKELGLLDPWYIALPGFWKKLIFEGSFGESIVIRAGLPVGELIWPKAKVSFEYGIVSLGIQLLIGMPLGVMMARKKGGIVDKVGNLYVLLINALPQAVYFLLIQLYLSTWLNLPMIVDRQGSLPSRILPIICLSLGGIASNAMWMRRYMVDQLNMDYIRTARAKGLSERVVILKHALKNALIPVITVVGLQIGLLFGGAILTETVFAWPGVGRLMIDSIRAKDTPVVQGGVIFTASIFVFINLLVDILYAYVDPRVKAQYKS